MSATLKWFSGAETGDISEFAGGQGSGTPVVQSTTKRSGTYALKCPSGSQATARVGFGAPSADVFCRLYFFIASNPSVKTKIWQTGGAGSNEFDLNLKTDGTLEFTYNGTIEATGADAVLLGAWNFVELHFVRSDTVGGMECFLNGVQEFSRFNIDTNNGTPPGNFALFRFGPKDGGGQDVYYDDMAVGTGAYIGPGQCAAVQGKSGAPTYNAWVKNGAADSFGCWSQTPFDATKNCTSITTSDRQTMLVDDAAFNTAIPSGSVVNGAVVVMVAKCASSTINIKILRRIGGTDTLGPNKILSATDKFVPNGNVNNATFDVFTDTLANLASAEIGVEDENSSITAQVEDMWLMVDFVPPAPPGTGSVVITGYQPTVSNPGGPTNTLITPGTGTLVLTGPRFVRVLQIGDLVLSWNVIERLNEILPLLWNVFGPGAVGVLALSWNVKETIAPLPVTWRVIPNLQALFVDIQGPVGTVVEIS